MRHLELLLPPADLASRQSRSDGVDDRNAPSAQPRWFWPMILEPVVAEFLSSDASRIPSGTP